MISPPLPPLEEFTGPKGRYATVLRIIETARPTVRELLGLLAAGGGHATVIGTPEQVADEIERWVDAGAADGFNLMPPNLPGGIEEFVDQVESGLPTGFIYRLELLKDRQWFDRRLDTSELQVVAMYDAANRGYLVNYKLDGKLVESRMVRRLDELEAAMTEIEDLPAFSLAEYPRSWRLLVRARAASGARSGFLVPDRPITDWVESRKFRSLNALPDEG